MAAAALALTLCALTAPPRERRVRGVPRVVLPVLGRIDGTHDSAGGYELEAFLGVPYAKPPLGDLRWRAPQDPERWGTLRAQTTAKTCPGAECNLPESEDCLTLDVYRPGNWRRLNSGRPLPVVVYIHGGSFYNGCGAWQPVKSFVANSMRDDKPVIAVTLNYRINVLGFFGSDALKGSDDTTGNYGLLDQRKALQFVQRYISRFGGDPRQVTLHGFSAGAASVGHHLIMPKSYQGDQLFHRVMMHSGLGLTTGVRPVSDMQVVYDETVTATNCTTNTVACLRALPVSAFASVLEQFNPAVPRDHLAFAPVVDGVEIPAHPSVLFAEGRHAMVPVLSGTTIDESAYIFANIIPADAPEAVFEGFWADNLGEEAVQAGLVEQVKQLYDASLVEYPSNLEPYSLAWWKVIRSTSDFLFVCNAQRQAQALSRNVDVYSFVYTHASKTQTSVGFSGDGSQVVTHQADLPYVYNCPRRVGRVGECGEFSQEKAGGEESLSDEEFAESLSRAWVEFAATGQIEGWTKKQPGAATTTELNARFNGGMRELASFRELQCGLWNQLQQAAEASYAA